MQIYKENFTLQIILTKSGTIALVAQMVKQEIGCKKKLPKFFGSLRCAI